MKITREQLKQIIKEELEEVVSKRAEPATEYELYSEFLAITKQLQEFRDNLDFAMGLTASATRQSQLSDEVYEMIRKASFALDTARTKFAQEIGQDPAPELRPVSEKDDKKNPDDIVARFPSSRPGEPDQVIYRWQQEEFDERERALKAFNKGKKK